jgi:hypothetical protein
MSEKCKQCGYNHGKEYVHCKGCGALAYKKNTYKGLSISCCLEKYIRELEKSLQPKLF